MKKAEVQLWLSKHESSFVTYDWISIGSIEYEEHADNEAIKEKIRALVDASEHKPFINAARLKLQTGEKITMTSVF